MKILSWNVNGLRARLDGVNRIIEDISPDILCFQKVRVKGAIEIPGYAACAMPLGDGLFGGVCTYVKHGIDIENQVVTIPERLMITACISIFDLGSFVLVNAYFPYANASNEKFVKARLRWDSEFHDFIVGLCCRKPVILCGDLNIVAQDIDAWDNKSIKNAGCFFPWEHQNFDVMMRDAGLVDSYRSLNPSKREYTFFYNNKPEYRLLNQGHRIDYFLVSRALMPDVVSSTILTDVVDAASTPILLETERMNVDCCLTAL